MATKETVIQKAEDFLAELRTHLLGVIEAAIPSVAQTVETAAADVAAAAPTVATIVQAAAPATAPIVQAAAPVVEEAAAAVEHVAQAEAEAPADNAGYKYAVVNEGDTLPSLANKLGLSNSYSELYKPNMAEIDDAARAAGHQGGSNSGEILIPGTVLKYKP